MAYNPNNCRSCDTPLEQGNCPLCSKLEEITSTISETKPEEIVEKVWNWEDFFKMVGNEEMLITNNSTDEQIEQRISALQELDKQTELLRQSIRIRISVDSTELEARGKRIKKPSTSSKLADFSSGSPLPKKSKAPQSKLEKAKSGFNALGIDFDAFTKDLGDI
jgi:hypothetical protein